MNEKREKYQYFYSKAEDGENITTNISVKT